MSNAIQFGWGRRSVGKGYSFAVLTVSVFAIINCNAYRPPIDLGMGTSPPRPWNLSKYSHNPCYWDYGKRVCGPAVYLMGIQYAGLAPLFRAIDLHPDVDCYSTGFFSRFSDMEEIQESDIEHYLDLFENTADRISSGSKLCICDSGRDLARPYDLKENAGVLSAPEFTTASALNMLYSGMKVIVILRDPTFRFIIEYCALGIATPFAEYVDDVIADFIDCENDATRETASCVYDASLSVLLQAGLYDFLIDQDVNLTISTDNYLLLHADQLENNATRRATMESIFNFLDKDIPSSYDSFWDSLDALYVPKFGNCNGQTITDAAKQKLKDFYSTRATIHLSLDPVP